MSQLDRNCRTLINSDVSLMAADIFFCSCIKPGTDNELPVLLIEKCGQSSPRRSCGAFFRPKEVLYCSGYFLVFGLICALSITS